MTFQLLRRAVASIALAPGDDQTQTQDAANPQTLNRQVQQLYPVSYFEARIARQALALAERKFGPDHPVVANALNNLALLYFVQGRDLSLLSRPFPGTEHSGTMHQDPDFIVSN